MKDLTALIAKLTEDVEEQESWSLSPEQLMSLLGVDPVTFWRTLHGARDRIGFAEAVDGWTHETVGDLVTILESLGAADVEGALTKAGLFVPWSLGVGLIEELLFRGRQLAAVHEVQTEELRAMLRHTGSVRKSVGIYLQSHLDVDALIDECARSFRVLQGLPPLMDVTAATWLRRMFVRHVLDRYELVVGLQERLTLAAAQMGFVDPEERTRTRARTGHAYGSAGGNGSADSSRHDRSGAPVRPATRQEWALRVMGFSRSAVTADMLRARYRELMMRYHPDADPTGLERCKDVNVAYSLLIVEAAR